LFIVHFSFAIFKWCYVCGVLTLQITMANARFVHLFIGGYRRCDFIKSSNRKWEMNDEQWQIRNY